MTENQIANIVFDAGLKVHRSLGAGLLESAYESCMFHELCKYDIYVERQKILPLVYDEIHIENGYRIDLMIDSKFIIELKSVESLSDLHMAQTLTYLKLSNCKLGMLINFNSVLFKDGVKRVINGKIQPLKY